MIRPTAKVFTQEGFHCIVANLDTLGTIPRVLFSEGKYCTNGSFGAATTVPFIEVSLFQSVLIEVFHCIHLFFQLRSAFHISSTPAAPVCCPPASPPMDS